MFFRTAADSRPYHYGPFPMESLPHDDRVVAQEGARPMAPPPRTAERPTGPLGAAARAYRELFLDMVDGKVAPQIAPVPTDLARRVVDLKGYAYFMNASLAGICRVPENAWLAGVDAPDHGFAVVILVEHERVPEAENLAHDWVAPAVGEVADMRAARKIVPCARCAVGAQLLHCALCHDGTAVDACATERRSRDCCCAPARCCAAARLLCGRFHD